MFKGLSTWGAVAIVLGFGIILGGGSVSGDLLILLLAGAALGLLGVGLILREVSMTATALGRAEALHAAAERDDRAMRIVDASGQTLIANQDGRRFWGDTDPMSVLEARLYDSDVDREAFARLRGAYQAGLDDVQDLSLKSIHGSGRDWVRVKVHALPTPPGARLVTAKDISARRALENVLKSEREYLADFLDYLPVGVYALDAEQNFQYVNETLAEWLGMPEDRLIGASLAMVLAKGSAQPEVDGSWCGLVQLQSARSGAFPALINHTLYDENSETVTRAVVVRDVVTDAADDAEHDTLNRLSRQVFAEAPVGIAVMDVEGLPHPMLAEANDTLAAMLGRSQDDLIGCSLEDMIDTSMRGEIAAALEQVAQGHTVAPLEVRLASPRDLTAMLHVRSLPRQVADDGAILVPARQLIHVVDTTDRRTLQMQTAQAQKMQAMGQLAGGVAHDFNNLLTAMIGFCDLLLQRHGPGSASFTDIMQIKQNANRAANLVRQLLAFSRRQPLMPRFITVTDALAEMSHLLQRLLGEAVDFRLVHGRDVGFVRVDPGQFDQVIINLAVNARDAMPGGGRLTIQTDVCTLSDPLKVGTESVAPGTYVRIVVSDTGTGIDKDVLSRIFEPFFSTKEGSAAAGTGLGLSTVYGIVRQTEGSVTVESAKGVGTTFSLYFPHFDEAAVRARSETAGQTTVASQGVVAGQDKADAVPFVPVMEPITMTLPENKVVLLVEDEDAVRVFSSRALKAKGYTVLEANCGEAALPILEDHGEVDVLVTDMVMPGMDGATLARRVRQDYPSINVILMSGYSEDIASEDLADNPDILFLAKPFSLDALAAKVAKSFEKREGSSKN